LAWNLADSGLEPVQVEEKIKEEKTQCDPADPATRLTWQDPVKNSVATH